MPVAKTIPVSSRAGSRIVVAEGNCSATDGTGVLGNFCCDHSNHSPIHAQNWITNDFYGRVSLTSTSWLGQDGQYHDWRSSYDTYHGSVPGDWPEAYNGGNFGAPFNNLSSTT